MTATHDRDPDSLYLTSTDDGESIEVWAARLWFQAYREIYRRERVVYAEWVDYGGCE